MTEQYTDEYFEIHQVTEELGRGGQGVVFKTSDPDIAIKLVIDEKGEPISNKDKIEKYSKQLKTLQLLPLPQNLQLSTPLAVLKDYAGYVMQLLSDMHPLGKLMFGTDSEEQTPKWLQEMDEDAKKRFIHYYKTGGTKTRFEILYKVACLLSRLHGNALVYGDISPNNLFYSDSLKIYLIDADNICIQSPKTKTIYTPKYGALELLENKSGISSQSDVWAFAVLAYELTTMNYPFELETNNNDDNWEDTNQSSGVENYDYSQLADNAIPQGLIFTEKLSSLLKQTLITGRSNPACRPPMFEFANVLAMAADTMIVCPECKMSYYYDYIEEENGKNQCPYCGTKRPEILLFESYFWNENKRSEKISWHFVQIVQNGKFVIPQRVFGEFLMQDCDDDALEVSFEDNFIVLKNIQDSIPLYVATAKSQTFSKIYGQVKIDKTAENEFYLFAESQNPRIIKIKILEEEK